ncbi:unnamed protein product [Cylicostephanus goldi]|uniref:Uncharacterized protein n=1 Tax=Cylicostephanus goldi TaxID=71465 RepID=A0A3P7MXI9_CYLGO|nr:unnamed protein product [Cylicostephanus goldi]
MLLQEDIVDGLMLVERNFPTKDEFVTITEFCTSKTCYQMTLVTFSAQLIIDTEKRTHKWN